MTKYLWALILCMGLGLSVTACGADDDDDDPPASGTGAVGGSAGTTAGVGGSPRAGTGGAAGSMMMSGPVMCGTATCASSLPMIPGLPAGVLPGPCCLNAAMNQCGVMMGGSCQMMPPRPEPHPNCPGARMGMMGCCIMGDCGQDATIFGMGCLENSRASAASMGLFPIPPPKKCDVPLTDAGMMMTDQDAGAE